jgi:acetyl-CoA C-acetyltransferase
LPAERTNPKGSGISLGHPLGATGAILTVKALYELARIGGKRALVTMCVGGGQGIAAIFRSRARSQWVALLTPEEIAG